MIILMEGNSGHDNLRRNMLVNSIHYFPESNISRGFYMLQYMYLAVDILAISTA